MKQGIVPYQAKLFYSIMVWDVLLCIEKQFMNEHEEGSQKGERWGIG